MRTDVLLAGLALVATACLWGSNHVLARAANGNVPFLAFVFWRWTLALVPMFSSDLLDAPAADRPSPTYEKAGPAYQLFTSFWLVASVR